MKNKTTAKAPDAHPHFSPVFESEKKYIGISGDEKIYGFAVSGGGIRSASFGLGVMQGLVAGRKLEKMHYLSTVSGGGYLGTALTWALHQGGHDAGTTPDKFPLGDKEAHTEHAVNKNGNKLLNYIRQHSSYLTPTEDLGLLSFVAVVVRGISMSLLVYVSALVAIMGGMYALGFFDTTFISELFHIKPDEAGHYFGGKGIFIPTAVFLMIVFMLMNMIYSVFTYIKEKDQRSQRKYRYFLDVQILMGTLWKIVIPLLLIGSIPFFLEGMGRIEKMIVASGSTTFGFLVSIWQYRKAQKEEQSPGVISDIVIYLGAFALIYGLLWGSFMIGRECVSHVVTGIVNGAEMPVREVQPLKAVIIILRGFEAQEQGKAMGLFGAGVVLAPALGPSIGGVLVEWFGWRSIFYVAAPFCLLALPLAARLLPHSAPGGGPVNADAARLDVLGLLLVAGAILLGLNGMSMLEGAEATLGLGMIGASLALLAVFVGYQRRVAHPLIRLELFFHATFTRGAIVAFIYGAALFGSTYLLPVFMQMALALPPSQAGAVLLPAGIVLAVVIPLVGRSSTVANRALYILVGLSLLSVSFVAMLFIGAGSSLGWLVALAILGRIGLGCILPSLNLAAMEGVGTGLVAQGTSLINLLRQLGGATGVGLIGVFLAWRLHADPGHPVRAFHEAFVLLGVITGGAIAAAWGMRRR